MVLNHHVVFILVTLYVAVLKTYLQTSPTGAQHKWDCFGWTDLIKPTRSVFLIQYRNGKNNWSWTVAGHTCTLQFRTADWGSIFIQNAAVIGQGLWPQITLQRTGISDTEKQFVSLERRGNQYIDKKHSSFEIL